MLPRFRIYIINRITFVQFVAFLLLPTHDGAKLHGRTKCWQQNFRVVRQVRIASEESNSPNCGLGTKRSDLHIPEKEALSVSSFVTRDKLLYAREKKHQQRRSEMEIEKL